MLGIWVFPSMNGPWLYGVLVGCIVSSAFATEGTPPPIAEGEGRLILTKSAFTDEGEIPKKHTCDGEDISPALAWRDVPGKTASLVLIMDDPDAPAGTWVHWVLYDLPAGLRELPEGLPRTGRPNVRGVHGVCWGVDHFDRIGSHGPCPPPGGPHSTSSSSTRSTASSSWPRGRRRPRSRTRCRGTCWQRRC